MKHNDKPRLQNLPPRTKEVRELRDALLEIGKPLVLHLDWQTLELRVAAESGEFEQFWGRTKR